MATSTETVTAYYDKHQAFYTLFWSRTALHYGLWCPGTKRLADAIANTDKFIVGALDIDSSDVVLDAGCGVGGSSLFIAETTGARVEGITLSALQLRIARRRLAKSRAAELLNISQQDYGSTNFEPATFSKAFAIESICHAANKIEVLNEACRIMKPSGRIAIVDAFLTERDLRSDEQAIYENAIAGWAVPNLPTCSDFASLLGQAGFTSVVFHDMQDYIWPSIRRIYRVSLLTYPVNFVCAALGLARRNRSARFQKALFDRRIATYGVFLAAKAETTAPQGTNGPGADGCSRARC